MSWFVWWPYALQAALMGVDELYCHRRRELRRWERWGHPLDTVGFLACLIFAAAVSPSMLSLKIYIAFCIFSCLLITKDEWQHRELCSGFENWLHALLFILHPVVLIWTGYLWWIHHSEVRMVLGVGIVTVSAFLLHQTLYWNLVRRDQQ